MENHHDFYFEKKMSKYLFAKEFKISKRNISKSPSSKSVEDTDNYQLDKKLELFEGDDNDLFFDKDHFLLESKLKIVKNPFLSNIKKNQHLTMKLHKDKCGDSFMKLRSKIIINDNISEFLNNLDLSDGNFDAFINSDILCNDEIIISDIKNNKINNNKKEEIQNIVQINNTTNDLTDKEKIVIEALSSFDKDYMNNIDKNFVLIDIEDFDSEKNYFEEIFQLKLNNNDSKEEYDQKKHIYEIINNRIKSYYDYYKKNKSYKKEESEKDIIIFQKEIKEILSIESLNDKFLFFGFKSIVLSLYVLVIRWLSKCHFKTYLKYIKEDNIYLDIFIELMEKYNKIKDICPFLEKDFKEIIEAFQQKKNIKFCLCELLTDIYWDYVFKIHKINFMFTNCYKLENIKNNVIFEEAKHAMKLIIDILIVNDIPYKKNIGEQLKLPYIKNENIFLMNYINKSKKNVNPFEIKNPFIETKDKTTEKENNNNNSEKNIPNNENNPGSLNNKKESEKESNQEENKNVDNLTLDELSKYITGDKNENKKHKKKNKNRKKKKKTKIETTKIEEEKEDPVVEEFIKYFIDYYKNNNECYTKIKPIISEEWIKSIS